MKFSNASKIAFIKRVFKNSIVANDGINVTVKCVNKKCSSYQKNKLKLAIRVDTDQAHCWVCGFKTSGSLFSIIKEVGSSEDIKEYIEKYSVSKKDILKADTNFVKNDLIHLPDDFSLVMENLNTKEGKLIYDYLKKRSISNSIIWKMCLGFSKQPHFEKRVIIPSFDENGDLNFYVSRTVENKFPRYTLAEKSKQDIVFNELRIDWKKELTIVEGPFDLFKSNENTTCLLGSSLNENYLLFWKIVKNKTPVLLALDNDAQQKTFKIAESLKKYDISVKILNTSNIEDVGSISNQQFELLKDSAKEWNSFDFLKSKINKINT